MRRNGRYANRAYFAALTRDIAHHNVNIHNDVHRETFSFFCNEAFGSRIKLAILTLPIDLNKKDLSIFFCKKIIRESTNICKTKIKD